MRLRAGPPALVAAAFGGALSLYAAGMTLVAQHQQPAPPQQPPVSRAGVDLVAFDAAQSRAPVAVDLFNLYSEGRHDQAAAGLAAVTDFDEFRRDLTRVRAKWPIRQTAGFLFEAADAAIRQARPDVRYGPGPKLLEDACALVRSLPADDGFARAWQLATLSLSQTPYGFAIDINPHLEHARPQLDRGRVELTRAITQELHAWWILTERLPALLTANQDARSRVSVDVAGAHRQLRETVAALERAREFEPVRAEATLRLGGLLTGLEQFDAALRILAQVDGLTDDVWARYLAKLFAGRAFEGLGRFDDAGAAYGDAARGRPEARSARLALAALLFARGQRTEADAHVRAILDQAGEDDPWVTYRDGEARLLEARRSLMREAGR